MEMQPRVESRSRFQQRADLRCSEYRGQGHRFRDQSLFWVAGVGLIAMLVVIVADIIGIKVCRSRYREVSRSSLSWRYSRWLWPSLTQVMRGHVAVDSS